MIPGRFTGYFVLVAILTPVLAGVAAPTCAVAFGLAPTRSHLLIRSRGGEPHSRLGSRSSLTRTGIDLPTSRHTQANLLVLRGGTTPLPSPKLIQWIVPALSSALSFGLYNIFIKLSSSSVHPILGGVVLQFVAATLGTIMLGASRDVDKFRFDKRGLLWSICAGIAVGVAEILSFTVSGMGVKASQSIPLMIGGSIVFGSVLGFIVLQERMTVRGWFGVLLVVLGIVCVATDPGAKMGH